MTWLEVEDEPLPGAEPNTAIGKSKIATPRLIEEVGDVVYLFVLIS
jgi:hypothetical protein